MRGQKVPAPEADSMGPVSVLVWEEGETPIKETRGSARLWGDKNT